MRKQGLRRNPLTRVAPFATVLRFVRGTWPLSMNVGRMSDDGLTQFEAIQFLFLQGLYRLGTKMLRLLESATP